jgi:prepilin signal peptidase PulO-like enzyme (type II secretory pathway)
MIAAALAGLSFAAHATDGEGVIAAFIAAVLVVVAATDLERRIIPNRVVLPATLVILIARIAMTPGRASNYALAALAAGLLFLMPNLISRSSIGMGDVKLAVFLGAGLGWSALGAIAIGFFGAFPFALAVLIRGGMSARKSTLPFGPFLAFGGLVILIIPQLVGLGGS